MVLKNIRLENLLSQEILYTKQVRGNLDFTIESHLLDNNTRLQIILKRNHPRIDDLLEKAKEKGLLTFQTQEANSGNGVLRLFINDDKFMINNTIDSHVVVRELNFNPKDFSIQDFEKGKVYIEIEITFQTETDNAKFKKELKDFYNKEDNIC